MVTFDGNVFECKIQWSIMHAVNELQWQKTMPRIKECGK